MKSNKGQGANYQHKVSYFCHCCYYNHISKNLSIVLIVSAATKILLYTNFKKIE